jgi:hypothetical protein
MYGTSRCGKDNPFYNKKHSEETKDKIRVKQTGKIYSIETKHKLSLARSGSKNHKSIKINIFDDKDDLKYECNGNFYDICKLHKLPAIPLRKSANKNGERIFMNPKYHTRIDVNYIGWYAKLSSID